MVDAIGLGPDKPGSVDLARQNGISAYRATLP
jgi:hypothetical protein